MNTNHFTYHYVIKHCGLLCFILLSTLYSVNAASDLDDVESRPPIISELRIGLFAHNARPFGSKEEGGADLNLEILFQNPKLFSKIGAPRPFIGTSINTAGDTSFLYSGLMWDFDITEPIFISLGLGMTIHNGNSGDTTDSEGRRALGCWWLFREYLELGLRIQEHVAIAVYSDHSSHGGVCGDRNRGMDNTGLRLHYKF